MTCSSPSSSSSSAVDHAEHNDEHDERTLTILYATETGTAQDVADRLARLCRGLCIRARVHSMDAYPPEELINEALVVFVVSTTGSGHEPRAMIPLWNMLLRADLPEDLFEDLSFAVFGLGDSAYEKFCWPAKLLSRRLVSLGASEFIARGEGDDQHGMGVDGALGPWTKQLSAALTDIFPLPDGIEPESSDTLPSARVSILDAEPGSHLTCKDPLSEDPSYHLASVTCNRRMTADDWNQDVRHFEFSFEGDIQYQPGDVAVIHPEALPSDVEAFLSCIGYANIADEPVTIQRTLDDQSLPDRLPTTTTIREIFTRYLDINAVPRRSFFELLKHFAQDELEIEKLGEFLSDEGAYEMYEYAQRPRRTIREVLEEFRSVRIPRDYIFDLFPPLRSRHFSISSSVKANPRSLHLCVAIIQYKTMLKIPRRGVCTTWLARLRPGDKLRIGLQKGFITLPPNPKTPVICIGPGTGIAPMRSIIQERIYDGIYENTLYFGCRHALKDHHYGEEWEQYASEGKLTYRVAFSRDGPEGVARTYVQHLIKEDSSRIWDLIETRNAWVYISGSSNKMPAAVRAALQQVLVSEGGKTEEDAKDYIVRMEREGRLTEECWS
ncbi:riboflavin synthase domain-like protein [Cubamyces menziesii]|nr:riboflavin synthase domain-like protein [Cubamyces menziesii]